MGLDYNPKYKLDNGRLREAGAVRVHEMLEEGRTHKEIARELEISIGTVYNIRKGYSWGHVLVDRTRAREQAAKAKAGQ